MAKALHTQRIKININILNILITGSLHIADQQKFFLQGVAADSLNYRLLLEWY
jgi:hypothetical protein